MSQENVESFKRAIDAYNRRDVDALVAELDPEVEWHPAMLTQLGGAAAVYRGQEGVREMLREVDDDLSEFHVEFSEIRDLGDQIVGIGRIRARGKTSGAETDAPIGGVADVIRNGKPARVRTYLDPEDALRAVGLRE